MIVWLASWPHSGNTLLRQIITSCFDRPTYSKYAEPELEYFTGPDGVSFSSEWSLEQYWQCQRSERIYFIKTHETPLDNSPAILVIRDGRDACASLAKYWDTTIRRVIVGEASTFCDWSRWCECWRPYQRPDTITVRFDEMLDDPDQIAELIAPIVAGPEGRPTRPFVNEFERHQKQYPKLFTSATKVGRWVEEFTRADEALFEQLHGRALRWLGY